MFTYKTRTLSMKRLCRTIIQVRWKTFTLLYGKFTQDNRYQILSELVGFYRRYNKNILLFFSVHSIVRIK